MYVQVNIGRNIDNTPMSDENWEKFKTKVIVALRIWADGNGNLNPEVHTGTGIWDGIEEESAKISLYSEDGFDLYGLREDLRQLKFEYSQDSIALITESELI